MEFKYFFLGIFFTLFVGVITIIAFNFGKVSNEADIDPSPPQPQLQRISTPTVTPISEKDSVENIIIKAIREKDYKAMEDHIENNVYLKIDGVEIDDQTPQSIIEELEYLGSAKGEWDTDQESETVKSLVATHPQEFSNMVIYTTTDNYLFAYNLNKDSSIDKIILYTSYISLLN